MILSNYKKDLNSTFVLHVTYIKACTVHKLMGRLFLTTLKIA